jgi:hypothetical protein
MTNLAPYLVSILDDARFPAPSALATSRLAVALGAERIDRDEFTAILSMDKERTEIWLAYAEWNQKFEYSKFADINSAWISYSSKWVFDCIIATSKIGIIQPGSDSFFVVVCTQDIVKTHIIEFRAMTSRFQEWSTDDSQSRYFIESMSDLKAKYATLID